MGDYSHSTTRTGTLTFSGNPMPAPLGQHFLSTPGPARALVRALDLKEEDVILEIGPGHGELTRFIVEAPHARIICIERDVRLAAALVHRYEGNPKVEIIHGDVREVLAQVAAPFGDSWKLAGNIPYYLTSYLVRLMGDLPHPPSRAALLMQREVAERISATQGTFTKLAAFAGAWSASSIVAHVPRSSFSPPPKVDSAILSFIRRESPVSNREAYNAVARQAFTQPRKVLLNNLLVGELTKDLIAEVLEKIGLTRTARPQDLSVEAIERLAETNLWT